jgi:hypothetical protein
MCLSKRPENSDLSVHQPSWGKSCEYANIESDEISPTIRKIFDHLAAELQRLELVQS